MERKMTPRHLLHPDRNRARTRNRVFGASLELNRLRVRARLRGISEAKKQEGATGSTRPLVFAVGGSVSPPSMAAFRVQGPAFGVGGGVGPTASCADTVS